MSYKAGLKYSPLLPFYAEKPPACIDCSDNNGSLLLLANAVAHPFVILVLHTVGFSLCRLRLKELLVVAACRFKSPRSKKADKFKALLFT